MLDVISLVTPHINVQSTNVTKSFSFFFSQRDTKRAMTAENYYLVNPRRVIRHD